MEFRIFRHRNFYPIVHSRYVVDLHSPMISTTLTIHDCLGCPGLVELRSAGGGLGLRDSPKCKHSHVEFDFARVLSPHQHSHNSQGDKVKVTQINLLRIVGSTSSPPSR